MLPHLPADAAALNAEQRVALFEAARKAQPGVPSARVGAVAASMQRLLHAFQTPPSLAPSVGMMAGGALSLFLALVAAVLLLGTS